MSSRSEEFLAVYREARVQDQRGWYERRARESRSAHSQLLLLSALAFGLSAAVGFLAGLDIAGKLVLAILATVLPAVTTMFSAYEGLYAFERNAKRYADAARNLNRVSTPRLSEAADQQAAVADYVARVEAILTNERGQWGQLATGPPAGEPEQA